jgi:hypothetical protein
MNESISHDDTHDNKIQESRKSKRSSIPPGVKAVDVLCGRDKVSHSHIGNKRFRRIIESFREQYQHAESRDQKTQISSQVIDMIHKDGGRFMKLEESTGLWEEVGSQYEREKVSHALRSAKDPNRPREKKPRKTKKYVPTEEENNAFRQALQDQQQIFQSLMATYSDGDSQQEDNGNDDEESMSTSSDTTDDDSISDYEHEDWDFYQ